MFALEYVIMYEQTWTEERDTFRFTLWVIRASRSWLTATAEANVDPTLNLTYRFAVLTI